MRLKITLLPGDGIGPEVTAEAVRVLRAVAEVYGHEFIFNEQPMGGAALKACGAPLPDETLRACLASDAVFLGAVGAPEFDQNPPELRPEKGLLALRQALGAFANLRPAYCYEELAECSPLRPERVAGADLLIVRELLGGLYFGEPRGFTSATEAYNTMRYSEMEVERVARVAFQAARVRRKLLTSVDKANVLETSRLWRRVVERVARDYPDVTLEHLYVDACAMHIITNPKRFDVILTENLFGDILSDEASVLSSSLGMLGSASIGGAVDLYEPVHGSAPDIAGQGVANPLGAIAAATMLLRYTAKLETEAQAVENAMRQVLSDGLRTRDLPAVNGSHVDTSEMGDGVVAAIPQNYMRQGRSSAA
jgi:3-isopropylmalate dehydrogenase